MAFEDYSIYPSPPEVKKSHKNIKVVFNDKVIAETTRPLLVLEKHHPPIYYIPVEDVKMEYLFESNLKIQCPFKGEASFWNIKVMERTISNSAWAYINPKSGYEILKGYVSFYPDRVDEYALSKEL